MKRIVTAVVTAIEALAIVLAEVSILAVPLLLVWIFSYGLSGDPVSLVGLVIGLWFFGNGVPFSVSLDATTAASFGLSPEPLTFALSLLPLGFALLTVLLSARIGWRLASLEPKTAVWGVIAGGATFFTLGYTLSTFAPRPLLSFGVFHAALMPTLLSGLGIGVAYLVRSGRDDAPWFARLRHHALGMLQPRWEWVLDSALLGARVAAYTLVLLSGATALVLGVTLATSYVEVVTLSQQLQVDAVGAVTLFLVNLAYFPTFLLWTLSWMVGPGFALGVGSSVSPIATELGPLPSIPILGALPSGSNPFALAIVAFVIVSGLVAVVGVLRQDTQAGAARPRLRALAVSIGFAAVLPALVVAALMALTTGSLGPGRLSEVGPQPWVVAGFLALEVLIGTSVGAWLSMTDWDRVSTAAKSSASGLRETVGSRVQAVLPQRLIPKKSGDKSGSAVVSEDKPDDSRMSDATHPADDGETVELAEFEPWWPDDEVR